MLNCVLCKFARAIVIDCVLHDLQFIERVCALMWINRLPGISRRPDIDIDGIAMRGCNW